MPRKSRDIEFQITVRMSKRLAIFFAVIGWVWGFLSMLYFSYVALTGENPLIDWTLGLPAYITYAFGLFGSGVWGMIFSCIVGSLIVMAVGALIIKFRRD